MAGRAQSSQPTIREELSPVDRLTPAVSAQQIFSYMQARPGYVAQGRDLQRLAESLDSFGGSFGRAARTYMDKKIAEDVSEAEQLYREHPELTKNMEAWRKAAEVDPSVLNISPWVKRYVEHAILRNEAQTIDAELRNFYVTSGLVNERDTKKVAEAVNAKMGELVRNSAASRYEDPLALGPNFHRPLRDVTGNLLAMHSASVEAQNAKLLMQEAHQNIDNMIRGITDPRFPNSLNPRLPSDAASLAGRHAAALQTVMGDMMARGFRQADLVQFATDSVLRTGGSVSRMEAVLRKVTVPGLDGKPVSLLSQPGVRDMLEQKRDMETDRAWKAETRAWTRRGWVMTLADEETKKKAFADGTSGNVMDYNTFVASGFDPRTWPSYVAGTKLSSDFVSNPLPTAPLSPDKYQQFRMDVITGKIGFADALGRFNELNEEQRKEVSGLFMGEAREERAAIAARRDASFRAILASRVGASKADQLISVGGPTDLMGRDAEAWKIAEEAVTPFVEQWEQAKQTQNRGNPLSPAQASAFSTEFTRKALEKIVAEYGRVPPADFTAQIAKYGAVLPNEGKLPGFFASRLSTAGFYWERRLSDFNSLMRGVDPQQDSIVDAAAFEKLKNNWDNGQLVVNSVEDMLLGLKAFGRLPDTPAAIFEFLTEKNPASLGLETEEQMLDWLRRRQITGTGL